MSDIVIDSSVVAKWILPEPESDQAQRLITTAAAEGGRLVVLDLVFSEVANAIWKRQRQKLITISEARELLGALQTVPVHIESTGRLLPAALEIAMKYDRAVYDALFVALVQELGLSGVTADEPLFNTTHIDLPGIKMLRDWA